MERRPAVMAALKIKQKTLRQRLGVSRPGMPLTVRPLGQMRSQSVPRSPKARLSVGIRGRLYRPQIQYTPVRLNRAPGPAVRQRGSLSRSASLSNLARSQSTGNLNTAGRFQHQVQNRTYQNANRFNVNKVNTFRPQRGMRLNNRGRGFVNVQRPYRGRGSQALGQRRGQFNQQQRGFGGGRGNFRQGQGGIRGARGQGRGQGIRGRGSRGARGARGRGGRPAPPSREELDKQLDQYMASTKSKLDRELDSYMNQGNEAN